MITERSAYFGGAESFKFLTYQLPTVGYWPTVAMTGNGELGFDSGEGARETATTSKEGSRRAGFRSQYFPRGSENWSVITGFDQ